MTTHRIGRTTMAWGMTTAAMLALGLTTATARAQCIEESFDPANAPAILDDIVAIDVAVNHAFSAEGIATIESPVPFRSFGIWWTSADDGHDHDHWHGSIANVTAIFESGECDRTYPVLESQDMSPENAGETGHANGRRVSGLVHLYDEPGRAVELQVADASAFESMRIVFIPWWIVDDVDPEQQPQYFFPAGTIFPQGYPKPPVSSRSSWGADPMQCNPGYCTTTHIGVHHTAGTSEYYSSGWSESAANVRAIQAYHMYTRGWCDIGYHYLIDVHGNIFVGRGGGDNIIGAHDGFNCGSMGVAFMGYFHTPYNQTLNSTMIDALAELGAWKCDQQGIDPLGTSYYSGYGSNMSNIYGHRNVKSTACPGDLAYAKLNNIRNEIDDRLQGGGGDEIILDNPTATFTQDWNTATGGSQTYGSNYRWRSTGISIGQAYWRPSIPQAGHYSLQFWWTSGSNRNPSTTVGARINGKTGTVHVNQQINGGRWNEVGIGYFPRGTRSLVGLTSAGPSGYVVIADAVRLVSVN